MVEGVAGNDERCVVGHRAALDGNATGMGSGEAEEVSKGFGDVLLYEGKGGRCIINVDVGIQSSEDKFGSEAWGIG